MPLNIKVALVSQPVCAPGNKLGQLILAVIRAKSLIYLGKTLTRIGYKSHMVSDHSGFRDATPTKLNPNLLDIKNKNKYCRNKTFRRSNT